MIPTVMDAALLGVPRCLLLLAMGTRQEQPWVRSMKHMRCSAQGLGGKVNKYHSGCFAGVSRGRKHWETLTQTCASVRSVPGVRSDVSLAENTVASTE